MLLRQGYVFVCETRIQLVFKWQLWHMYQASGAHKAVLDEILIQFCGYF